MKLPPDHPLHSIKPLVQDMQKRLDGHAWASVAAGSALAGDDDAEDAVHVSVSGAQPFVAAVDHMHAFMAVVDMEDDEHIAAPSTLLRGVIESASQVVWLLAPHDRPARVLRSLRLQHEDAQQQVAAHKAVVEMLAAENPELFELEQNSAARDRLASLEQAGSRLGYNLRKNKLTSTHVVNEASIVTGVKWAPWVWRVSSGVAHGRSWALLGSNVVEILDGDIGAGRHRVRMSADDKIVASSAVVAWRILEAASNIWDERRSNRRAAARARAIAFDPSP